MKKNFLVVLPLAITLAMPAIAQQSADQQNAPAATQSSDQQSSSSTQQSSAAQEPSSNPELATGKEPLTYERHEGFWGKINPMARKKYVQRQMQPIRDRVNELDELTAANSKMIKDVDARAQQGIQMASAKATQADQDALAAGSRADQAQQTAQDASTRLTTVQNVVGNIDQYQPMTETEIQFRPGQQVLSQKAKDALDQMAESVKDQKGYIVEVEGFSPGRGQAAVANSQKMAESVVRYLVLNHDIPVYRIYLMGMGNAVPRTASADGTPTARRTSGGRVDVKLMKNGVGELAQAQGVQSAAPMGSAGQAGPSGTGYQTPAQQPTGMNDTQQ